MNIGESKEAHTLVMSLEGRLDAQSAPSLQGTLFERLDAGEKSVLLDLANLEYISSAGLRVILLTAKKLNESQGKLVTCSLQESVREVFRVSGFDSIIEVQDNREAGVSSLSS